MRRGRFLGSALGLLMVTVVAANAAEQALWLRQPAISPDGRTVVFSYRGDLWTVAVAGGTASPLTVHSAYDTSPVWSPDGRNIAFASDRYGNFDVFVMPAAGGDATRLTLHSADESPTSFTPDGLAVLFSAARLDSVTNVQFPTGAQPELYKVALTGGMPSLVLSTPALYAVYDDAGARLALLRSERLRDGVAQARQLVVRARCLDLGFRRQQAHDADRFRLRRPAAGVGARPEIALLSLRAQRHLQRVAHEHR